MLFTPHRSGGTRVSQEPVLREQPGTRDLTTTLNYDPATGEEEARGTLVGFVSE